MSGDLYRVSIRQFESGQLDPERFDHASHVYLAWLYLGKYGTAEALEKFAGALKRLTRQIGATDKYHETITWFYLLLIGERMEQGKARTWQDFRRQNPDLLDSPGELLSHYYPGDILKTDKARSSFILPRPRTQS